jgi:hypothetical protein
MPNRGLDREAAGGVKSRFFQQYQENIVK